MNSKIKNSVLNKGRMEVLGLVSLKLPPPWWWHCTDLENESGEGATFYAYKDEEETEGEEETELDIAQIIVADVTSDPDELDISSLDENSAKDYDQFLHREIKKTLHNDGIEVIKWMSSQLNETKNLKGLITAYIIKDQGKERQMIALRMRVREFNLVIIGCFDIAMKDELVGPIYNAIGDIFVLPPPGFSPHN